MKIRTEITRPRLKGSQVLITGKQPAVEGGYIYSGIPLGAGVDGKVAFYDPRSRQRFAMVQAPQTIVNVTAEAGGADAGGRGDEAEPAEQSKPKGPSSKRQGEIPGEIRNQLFTGGVMLAGTHVLQKGGAALMGPALAGHLGVGDSAAAVQNVTRTLETTARSWDVGLLGNVVKLLVLALTLFGVSVKLLEFVFGDDKPAWAWVLTSAVNLALVAWAAMYLFDWGPYAAPPVG